MRTALLVSVAAATLLAPTVSVTTTGLRGRKKALGKELLLGTQTDRPARIILPTNYEDKAAWPVIMALHVRLSSLFICLNLWDGPASRYTSLSSAYCLL